jgi:protein SCO1/2
MLAVPILDQDTPEDVFAALVDAVRASPDQRRALVEILRERHPVYEGRSTNATIRMRGYALAAFEDVGLPDAAFLYCVEELESGRDAYLVAAAAKALRGLDGPEPGLVPFLFKAIHNIRDVDDRVAFDVYRPDRPLAAHTTALMEIFRTFAWLGPHARSGLPRLEALAAEHGAFSREVQAALAIAIDAIRTDTVPMPTASCCDGLIDGGLPKDSSGPIAQSDPSVLFDIALQDQDGTILPYGDFFIGQPSVVVFFYTRCTNPNKCSLTVTKLARLQDAITRSGLRGRIRTAGITYDPGFDIPPRLRAYGENRGIAFNADNRLFRTPVDFDVLRDQFELGVNYGPALVNRHRIELFILDETGRVAATFARVQWDVDDVLARAAAMLVTPVG